MNTSILLVALASLLGTSAPLEVPTWSNDYVQARKQGLSQQKPLAVVFGIGTDGQAKVCRDGKLSDETQSVLAEKYVCVYVDLASPAGKELASSFGITSQNGLVISDRTGALQAFHSNGDLSAVDLSKSLERFSNPQVVVNTTVTDINARVSYYPADGSSSYIQQLNGTTYCPNCRR